MTQKNNQATIENPALLLRAVQKLLNDTVVPKLDGYEQHNARVAINTLGIVTRQMRLQATLDEADAQGMTQLGLEPTTSQEALAQMIRNGQVSKSAILMRYLQRRTLIRMQIDAPQYWGYAQGQSRWGEGGIR